MNLTRKEYLDTGQKVIDFVIGFFGWFILNGILWFVLGLIATAFGAVLDPSSTAGSEDPVQVLFSLIFLGISCIPLLLNIGLIIYFGLTRYWIALGMLSAFALVICLVIIAGVFFTAACFAILGSLGP